MSSRPDLIDPEVALEYMEEGRVQFLDARPPIAYQHSRERIPGAIHVDPGSGAGITDVLWELPREKMMVAYCDEPGQAASTQIARRVRELGIGDGCALRGGLRGWRDAGLPTEMAATPGWPEAAGAGADQLGVAQGRHFITRGAEGIGLTVQAGLLPALFEETARAVADVFGVARHSLEPDTHHVTLRARGREALLMTWIDALIVRTAQEQRLFTDVAVLAILQQASDQELRAHVRGAQAADWWVKPHAGTLPDVAIEQRADGFEAVVTLHL